MKRRRFIACVLSVWGVAFAGLRGGKDSSRSKHAVDWRNDCCVKNGWILRRSDS